MRIYYEHSLSHLTLIMSDNEPALRDAAARIQPNVAIIPYWLWVHDLVDALHAWLDPQVSRLPGRSRLAEAVRMRSAAGRP